MRDCANNGTLLPQGVSISAPNPFQTSMNDKPYDSPKQDGGGF